MSFYRELGEKLLFDRYVLVNERYANWVVDEVFHFRVQQIGCTGLEYRAYSHVVHGDLFMLLSAVPSALQPMQRLRLHRALSE